MSKEANSVEHALKLALKGLKLIESQDQGCGGNVTEAEAWRSAKSIAWNTIKALEEALANHIPDATKMVSSVKDSLTTQQEQGVDWKDMYEKEKRRSAMWIAKYENDIGPLERATPQQEQGEPVALKVYRGELCYKSQADDQSFGMWCPVTQDLPFPEGTKFYTTPYVPTGRQQRTWVGLTDGEVIDLWPDLIMHRHTYQFWQNLEAKLKEKNT